MTGASTRVLALNLGYHIRSREKGITVGSFRVRQGTLSDIEEMVRQRHEMFVDMGRPSAKALRIHDSSFPDWARREMRAKRFICFLVENDGGEVIGGGSLWLRGVQPFPGYAGGKVPYLMSMYTAPGYRGRGVGTMLVKRAIEWSKSHGYTSITLHSSKMGRQLYEKLGWKSSPEMELIF